MSRHTSRRGRHAAATTHRRRRTVTVPAEDFPGFRRSLVTTGGSVIMSAPVAGGFVVTYVIGHAR